jgi:2-epi-valiolone-7-phosphate 1-reductase
MGPYLAFVRNARPEGLGIELRRPPENIGTGDLLCRTQVAGVCGTDLQILRGLRNDPAAVLGHEGVAVVETVSGSSDQNMVGQLIVINPTSPTTGIAELGHTEDGLMQEIFVVPARFRKQTLRALPGLNPHLATLVEPLSTVLMALSVIQRIHNPRSVLIVGRGTIGQLFRISLPRSCKSVESIAITSTAGEAIVTKHSFDTVILCMNCDRAAAAIRIGVHALRPKGLFYLFGGIPREYCDPHFPGVGLSAVRFLNSGGIGQDPIGMRVTLSGGSVVTMAGSRGASNQDMVNAMNELVANASAYYGLLTVVSEPSVALRFLHNAIKYPLQRNWIKLAIDMRSWSQHG